MPTSTEYVMTIMTNDGITTDTASTPFESYSFGTAANIGSQSSGSGAGKVTFNPFSITRKIDKASPNLFRACVNGQHFKKVILQIRSVAPKGTTPTDFLTIALQDVLVSHVSEAGNVHGGPVPLEEIGFVYRSFQMTVDGVTAGYDFELGKVA